MQKLIEQLRAPFPAAAVSWRVGSTTGDKKRGMALCYIDARDVMARLDDACGPMGWSSRHEVSADGKKVTCHIAIRNPETGEWVSKSDGAGETDYEAEKGSYSDSLKRSAVSWGVGRYLYDVDAPWVAIEPAGKSFKIIDSEMPKLRAMLSKGAAPPPASARPPVPPPTATPAISDWDTVVNDIIGEIAKTKTGADMDKLGDANKRRMEKMPAEFKQRVYAVAKRHREQIALPAMAAG